MSRFLLAQKKVDGGYGSTADTLEVLRAFAARASSPSVNTKSTQFQ